MKMAIQSEHKNIPSSCLGKIDSQRLLVTLKEQGNREWRLQFVHHMLSLLLLPSHSLPLLQIKQPPIQKTTVQAPLKLKISIQQFFNKKIIFYKEMRILEIQDKSLFAACIGFANIYSGIITQQQSNTVPMVFKCLF